MNINLKSFLILLLTISKIFASVNDKCTGRNGICITTSTCSSYGGKTYSGYCPYDPSNVLCCDDITCTADDGRKGTCVHTSQCSGSTVDGKCPGGSDFKCCVSSDGGSSSMDTAYGMPCNGGGGSCINLDNTSCDTSTASGKCPGGSNIKCCVAGKTPAWYINQGKYKNYVSPDGATVANSGCGISSLAMGIRLLTGVNISPETLFREGNQYGYYCGSGFCHGDLVNLGRLHGLRVSWTDDVESVFNALKKGLGVIFHVRPESKYHFTKGGHYIFLYGAKIQDKVKKVYVFDPNGYNNNINVLFPLKSADGGIQVAQKQTGADFAILQKK